MDSTLILKPCLSVSLMLIPTCKGYHLAQLQRSSKQRFIPSSSSCNILKCMWFPRIILAWLYKSNMPLQPINSDCHAGVCCKGCFFTRSRLSKFEQQSRQFMTKTLQFQKWLSYCRCTSHLGNIALFSLHSQLFHDHHLDCLKRVTP